MKLIFACALLCCVAVLLRAEDAENPGTVEGGFGKADIDARSVKEVEEQEGGFGKADIGVRSVEEVEEQDDENDDQSDINARSAEDANEEDDDESDPSVRSLDEQKKFWPGTCLRRNRIIAWIRFWHRGGYYHCNLRPRYLSHTCLRNGAWCTLRGRRGRCYTRKYRRNNHRAICRRLFPRPTRWFWARVWFHLWRCCCVTRKLG